MDVEFFMCLLTKYPLWIVKRQNLFQIALNFEYYIWMNRIEKFHCSSQETKIVEFKTFEMIYVCSIFFENILSNL